jgi:hypothetical protein
MTTTTTDPRTELVRQHADDVAHSWCADCWQPGMPLMCGEPDFDGEECPDGCGCPQCPLCIAAWEQHVC